MHYQIHMGVRLCEFNKHWTQIFASLNNNTIDWNGTASCSNGMEFLFFTIFHFLFKHINKIIITIITMKMESMSATIAWREQCWERQNDKNNLNKIEMRDNKFHRIIFQVLNTVHPSRGQLTYCKSNFELKIYTMKWHQQPRDETTYAVTDAYNFWQRYYTKWEYDIHQLAPSYSYCIHFDFFIVIWHKTTQRFTRIMFLFHFFSITQKKLLFILCWTVFFFVAAHIFIMVSLFFLSFFLNEINVLSHFGMWFYSTFILIYPVHQTVIHHYYTSAKPAASMLKCWAWCTIFILYV